MQTLNLLSLWGGGGGGEEREREHWKFNLQDSNTYATMRSPFLQKQGIALNMVESP